MPSGSHHRQSYEQELSIEQSLTVFLGGAQDSIHVLGYEWSNCLPFLTRPITSTTTRDMKLAQRRFSRPVTSLVECDVGGLLEMFVPASPAPAIPTGRRWERPGVTG